VSGPSSTQILAATALGQSLVVRDFHLEVLAGPDRGKRFGPFIPPVRIGTARGNDLSLTDPTVSRFHCTVDAGTEGLLIADVGSKNGTFLGDYRVKEAYLGEGALIRLGQTTLRLAVTGPPRKVEFSKENSFGGLLGDSPVMRALFATLERLARADAPVLIEGETGSGKELVARALHARGPREGKPFVVVDCGAVAPTLIESELFGHTRGAFTGADQPRAGAFELAEGGTVFLDEIGELALPLQPKLLRALETRTIKRLGAPEEKTVNVRAIAATHRDLRQMVNDGSFREDLYFRLAIVPVRIPPLRDRLEDMPILTRHFLRRSLGALLGPSVDTSAVEPTRETLSVLRAQNFTGYV
jgi:transcriptional regulator with GAF, ATPase, and Fis domain